MFMFDSRIFTFFVWLTFRFDYGTFTCDYCAGGFCGDVSNLDSAILPGNVWFIAGFTFDYWTFFT